jgi:predicted outer membrane repeat protein
MVKAAVDGDTLRVKGTCRSEDVVIRSDVTVTGTGTRHPRPVLTGSGRLRVVRVVADARVRLRHLTIANGSGGILNYGSLTLVDSVVRDNSAPEFGGGILSWGEEADLRLVGSVVRQNVADWGGGIRNENGTLTLTDSVIRDNRAEDGGGGGIADEGGTMTVRGSRIRRNAATLGGGIHHWGFATLVDTVVARNTAEIEGGGIYAGDIQFTLVDSVVRGNTAGDKGGGTFAGYGGLSLTRALVTANAAGTAGGGIFNDQAVVDVDDATTVTGNTPDDCVGTTAC